MNAPDDLDLKRRLDALPRSIEPPADAWPGVRARLSPAHRAVSPRRTAHRSFTWPEIFEPKTIRIAAGIAMIGIGLTYLGASTRAASRWFVTSYTDARPSRRMEGRITGFQQPLLPGGEIRTGRDQRAIIAVGHIGHVEVSEGTALRLLAAGAAAHRMQLEHGQIQARIDAPPRLFIVQTPTGIATDMGCAYLLDVDSLGGSRLAVRVGWVTFENHGRESLVPGGFVVTTPASSHVGTPVHERSLYRHVDPIPGVGSPTYAELIRQLDAGDRSDSLLTRILHASLPADGVTLWHMLPWVCAAQKNRVFDRLAELAPPPQGVTRAGAIAGDRIMMRLWWEKLPGTLPITPDLTKRLWMVWLKVASWL